MTGSREKSYKPKTATALRGLRLRLTADCAALSILANNYTAMANQTETIVTSLQVILQQWQTLADDLENPIQDIQSAMQDLSANVIPKVLLDLTSAQIGWQGGYYQSFGMVVPLQISNAAVQPPKAPVASGRGCREAQAGRQIRAAEDDVRLCRPRNARSRRKDAQ